VSLTGGYDDGYKACSCFWGLGPSSLVVKMFESVPDVTEMRVLDVGCGEGKNAMFLARKGARVTAIDISPLALRNAQLAWSDSHLVDWRLGDVRRILEMLPQNSFDIVIAYGLFHCFGALDEVANCVARLKVLTAPKGYHLVCAFNKRDQDLSAHQSFQPLLLDHNVYARLYNDYNLLVCSDSDLTETHPHNKIRHRHSMTRIFAQRKESK
jgi:tellurite methyltransferase